MDCTNAQDAARILWAEEGDLEVVKWALPVVRLLGILYTEHGWVRRGFIRSHQLRHSLHWLRQTKEGKKYWVPQRLKPKSSTSLSVCIRIGAAREHDSQAKRWRGRMFHYYGYWWSSESYLEGKFTPNRTMTCPSHFVSHGIVNAENEENTAEVYTYLHRKHGLFVV